MWTADFDGDGINDLAIGAPGASAFGRAQCGQVYLVWGGATLATNRSLANSNVVFSGAAAGYRLGASISMGAIVRDRFNDLAMLAPGANSGTGEIDVFYGRSRAGLPFSNDLASTANRRILANASDAPLQQIIVWDVLGKGSESIVGAAPGATTGAGAVRAASTLRFAHARSSCGHHLDPRHRRKGDESRLHGDEPRRTGNRVDVVHRRPMARRRLARQRRGGRAGRRRIFHPLESRARQLHRERLRDAVHTRFLAGAAQVTVKVSVTFQSTTRRSDFDGDGRDDIALFQPSNGGWNVLASTTNTGSSSAWGIASDIPVPGDYDGDGVVDVAVYRPSSGTWFIRGQPSVTWGAPGDIPVPADYDGDGRTDIAVFRPATGMWYVFGLFSAQFGAAGDIPVPGDYRGIGSAQFAVYRHGTWLIQGLAAISWGLPNDIPVPADYDGNGTTDVAVYRAGAISSWFVRGVVAMQWGTAGDIPVPEDVDGDGRAELVVYRPRTGTSFGVNARTGVTTVSAFGSAGDLPVAAPNLRRTITADLDGDRRSDVSVFRPSSGAWFWLASTTGSVGSTSFGQNGDIPVAADYLGWHVNQPAVFRSGMWLIQNGPTIALGSAGNVPVPADYDGDGRTDVAVFDNGGLVDSEIVRLVLGITVHVFLGHDRRRPRGGRLRRRRQRGPCCLPKRGLVDPVFVDELRDVAIDCMGHDRRHRRAGGLRRRRQDRSSRLP